MVIFKYLIIINIISAGLFILDKIKAQAGYRRIPEIQLYLLEIFGGVFVIIPLIYFIQHKSQKTGYLVISFLILLIWIFIIFYLWNPGNIVQ